MALAGPDEAADLGGYLTRLLRFDKAAAVRVVASGAAVGVYGRPPFDVLTLRTLALAAEALPRPLAGATAWTGFLPPRTGWQPVGELPVAEVETAALAAIGEFKQRAETIPDRERTRAAVDRVAAEIWDRPLSLGLPVRAAHAARAMGFLGPAQSAATAVRSAGRWLRLDAPYGTIVLRTGSGLL
ncbi:MAG: hypothetical protein AUG49_15150 [Catenulispora sp. 13_1_20CM_3_70_7]|nr:MAG: hypothetical protein AUG49_15150 [Catenulispora sp. 13_1_20CM_3_70_7]